MTFCIAALFKRWASDNDLAAVSIPTVTKAVSGWTDTMPLPLTVKVGVSGPVPPPAWTEMGVINSANKNVSSRMAAPFVFLLFFLRIAPRWMRLSFGFGRLGCLFDPVKKVRGDVTAHERKALRA
jgi:hypothetical protein